MKPNGFNQENKGDIIMDYINLTAETLAEIRGTKEITPKLVTDSLTIDFEAMTDVEKLMHKAIEELDMKALELAMKEGISLEEARKKNGRICNRKNED